MTTATITLAELLTTYRPESWGGTRGETWPEHARYLWALDPEYMRGMAAHMGRLGAWFGGPVVVDGRVVQDAHHRIVTALGLRWYGLAIPIH